MKKTFCVLLAMVSAAVNAGFWEGLTEANHIQGPRIAEKDLMGKVVVLYVISGSEDGLKPANRLEDIWKAFDKKRFQLVGSYDGDKEKAVADLAKQKLSFPVYKEFKLASDTEVRTPGSVVIVSQFGKILAATTMHGSFNRDHEQILVEAISTVGAAPNVAPGVALEKYKALKTKLKLGVNLKNIIKGLEKDVSAAEKKTATEQVKAKAEEARSILSAIKEGKSDVMENITALADVNPVEAFSLLSLYVKSFPDEAADNRERLAELKAKAAEFRKQQK